MSHGQNRNPDCRCGDGSVDEGNDRFTESLERPYFEADLALVRLYVVVASRDLLLPKRVAEGKESRAEQRRSQARFPTTVASPISKHRSTFL